MSKVIRTVKNVTKGYTSAQIKVREATSNDPWGPTGTQMKEIAEMTFSRTEFPGIIEILEKRLNDKGKHWLHVLKCLKVLDYCLHEGSTEVVDWARRNIYLVKTHREFQHVDDSGLDVGQNVRVAAKELTNLILDDERLRLEREDRKTWKSRVAGLEEQPPTPSVRPQRQASARPPGDEDDTEYRLALEASKYQEEEDRKRRESKSLVGDDADLAKAIKLSKEEEDTRKKREHDAASFYEDESSPTLQPVQPSQPMYTGFNQGYQQGIAVDFSANPIDPNSFLSPAFTGISQQQTAYLQPQSTSFSANLYTNGLPVRQLQPMQSQDTAFNPYSQPRWAQSDPSLQPGSNNPWANATANAAVPQVQSGPRQLGSDSNNPFGSSYGRQPSFANPSMSSLSTLPEASPLATFPPMPVAQSQQVAYKPPAKPLSNHEAKLNTLLANSDGMDTFGNTGNMRIPSQHTAPGTFVNSAGTGIGRLNSDQTGNNPFLRVQMTGLPSISHGLGQQTTGLPFPIMNSRQRGNPFAAGSLPPNGQAQDLISFN